MIQIRFLCQMAPDSIETEEKTATAEVGDLLTQVAYRAGVVIQQTCGGTPSCTDCKVIVKAGLTSGLEPPTGPELRLMGNVSHITQERLSCQSIVKNDVTVYVPSPASMRRKQKASHQPHRGVMKNGQSQKNDKKR